MSAIADNDPTGAQQEQAPRSPPGILVLTGNEAFAEEAREQLSGSGHAVQSLSPSAQWASAEFETDGPAAAFIDLGASGVDGGPLYRAVRGKWPACQLVLACTSEQSSEAARLTQSGEVWDYVLMDSSRDDHRLPLLAARAAASRAEGAAADGRHPPDAAPRHTTLAAEGEILVVDDDPTSCEMARFILEGHGYRVLVAGSLKAAQTALHQHAPRLVLMDVHLGHVSGIGFVASLRKGEVHAETGVPVIVVTGDGTRATVFSALDLNIQGYILKPYTPDLLIQKVECVLRARATATAGAEDHLGQLV